MLPIRVHRYDELVSQPDYLFESCDQRGPVSPIVFLEDGVGARVVNSFQDARRCIFRAVVNQEDIVRIDLPQPSEEALEVSLFVVNRDKNYSTRHVFRIRTS